MGGAGRRGYLSRVVLPQVNYIGSNSHEPSSEEPDVGKYETLVPALRLRPGATWNRGSSSWQLRSKTAPPISLQAVTASKAPAKRQAPSARVTRAGGAQPQVVKAQRLLPARMAHKAASGAGSGSYSLGGSDDDDDDGGGAASSNSDEGAEASSSSSGDNMSDAARGTSELRASSGHAAHHRSSCEVCEKGGEVQLVCCAGCPRAFHAACLVPHLPELSAPFFCPFCVMGVAGSAAPADCCAACGIPPPLADGLAVELRLEKTTIAVDAGFIVRCACCDAGFLPCCLEVSFGPALAAQVAPYGAANPRDRPRRRLQFDLRCRQCVASNAVPGAVPVEAILAHRLRFVRNAALDRAVGHSVPLVLGVTAALPTSAVTTATSAVTAADISYLPQFQFFVKWRGRSHWHDSWVPAVLLEHVARQLLQSYQRSFGLSSARAELAMGLIGPVEAARSHKRWTSRVVVYSDDTPAEYAPEAYVRLRCRAPHLTISVARAPWHDNGGTPQDDLQPDVYATLAVIPGVGCALPLPRIVGSEALRAAHAPSSAPASPSAAGAPALEMSLVPQYLDSFESRIAETFDESDEESGSSGGSDDETPESTAEGLARSAARAAARASQPVLGVSDPSVPRPYSPLSAERCFRPEHLVVGRVVAVRRAALAESQRPWGARDLTPALADVAQRLRMRAVVAASPALYERLGLSLPPTCITSPSDTIKVGPGLVCGRLLRYDHSSVDLREAVARRGLVYGGLEMLVRWKGCTSAEATWEPAPLVAAVAPAAVLHFYRVNGRCLQSALEAERALVAEMTGSPRAVESDASLDKVSTESSASGGEVIGENAASSRTGDPGTAIASFRTSPAFLPKQLFPYQLEGLNWLINRNAHHIGACLAGGLRGRVDCWGVV